MIEHIVHYAIGIVYCVFFACKIRACMPCPLIKLIRKLPTEDFCDLALGILYQLSAMYSE